MMLSPAVRQTVGLHDVRSGAHRIGHGVLVADLGAIADQHDAKRAAGLQTFADHLTITFFEDVQGQ